ncbi:MAG: alpha/beta hydrolase [Bacilli bacterium]
MINNPNIKTIEITKKLGFTSTGKLTLYSLNENHPVILILPGGGYHHLSNRESKPVANKFLEMNYNVAILEYSVAPFQNPTQFIEVEYSLKYLHRNFKNIFVMGFSAGGHLAALAGTSHLKKYITGLILCYPVISFIKKPHKGTVTNFFNGQYTKKDLYDYSIENRVTKDTPPTFIWSTKEDKTVPYIHTLLMVDALTSNDVYNEFIIFNTGRHGLALADQTAIKDGDESYINKEVAIWPTKANEFIKKVLHYEEEND